MRTLVRRALLAWGAGWLLGAPAVPVLSQARETVPAPAVITVQFSNPAASPSHWVLSFRADGSGHFQSTTPKAQAEQPAPASAQVDWEQDMPLPDVNRDIQLSPKFAAAAFQLAKRHTWFNQPCESHLKVAFQGWKTLSYAGPEGKGSCTFNYSRDKQIQALGNSFLAVSETILEGERLEMLLQHDPLGLDREMENLSAAAEDGTAQQIYVIRGILQRIVQDDNVMQMVRKRAEMLLAKAQS